MPSTKGSGIEARLQLNGDFRDGYWAGVEATKAERDELLEALNAGNLSGETAEIRTWCGAVLGNLERPE